MAILWILPHTIKKKENVRNNKCKNKERMNKNAGKRIWKERKKERWKINAIRRRRKKEERENKKVDE